MTIRKWLDDCLKRMREKEQSLIAGKVTYYFQNAASKLTSQTLSIYFYLLFWGHLITQLKEFPSLKNKQKRIS